MRKLLLFVFLSFSCGYSISQEVLVLEEMRFPILITDKALIFEDESAKLTFEEIINPAIQKKFKYSNIHKLLLKIIGENKERQKSKLESAFLNWKGDLEQVDDVCIIGIKI